MSRGRFARDSPLASHVRTQGHVATITFDGDLDLSTLAVARRALADAEAGGAQGVVIDLRLVDFFDLSGLRVLFEAHDRWGSKLRIVSRPTEVDDLLEFSGLAKALVDERGSRPARSRSRFRRG